MEIIEDSGATRVCPQTLNYPLQVAYAAGSSLPDNTISICGGYISRLGYSSECYTLKDSKWEKGGNLLTTEIYHASSTIGNGKGTYIQLALIANTYQMSQQNHNSFALKN